MSADKGIIFALLGRGERANAVKLTIGAELLTTTRQNLVSVCLMPYIPHDTVLRRIKYIMQGHRQLHHTEARCQMAWINRKLLYYVLTQLIADLRQVLGLQQA